MMTEPFLIRCLYLGLALLLLLLVATAARGGEMRCAENPQRPIRTHWSWRMVDGQKCWFKGKMRPASELSWPAPVTPQWEVEHRWLDPRGWTHGE